MATALITPSRASLLPIHNIDHGPLQPSAMPAPPTSHSPRSTAPFVLPSKLSRSQVTRIGQSASKDLVQIWQGTLPSVFNDGGRARDGAEVAALSAVDINAGPSPKRLRPGIDSPRRLPSNIKSPESRQALKDLEILRTKSIQPLSIAKSVPKHALEPDIFTPDPTAFRPLNAFNNATKRMHDAGKMGPPPSTSKRAKVDENGAVRGQKPVLDRTLWDEKWKKAFPGLIFHFEIGADDAKKSLAQRVAKMGAKVEPFLSTRVTHVIVKGITSPQKTATVSKRDSARDSVRDSPRNPFLDNTGETSLVHKAEKMGMKVWPNRKLIDILDRLAPVSLSRADSLRTLLEDERLHGTRERDLSAPRPDYYYFKPGSKYLLVEDATGRHKPIMTKEYSMSLGQDEWPVLFETFLRPSASNRSNIPPDKVRERAWTLYIRREPWQGEQPPMRQDASTGQLRRATSMQRMPGTALPPAEPVYQKASGNSVAITSNIASTSTANFSPAMLGLPHLAAKGDRSMQAISKRVQVLKGNAHLAAKKQTAALQNPFIVPSSTTHATQPTQRGLPTKTFWTQEQVIRMLTEMRAPKLNENVSYEERAKNRAEVDAGLKGREAESASGYCENCRLRYSDLSSHVASRKHRRFAEDDDNFTSLDALLATLIRPPVGAPPVDGYEPCWEPHGLYDHCIKCHGYEDPDRKKRRPVILDADQNPEDGIEDDDEDAYEDEDTDEDECNAGPDWNNKEVLFAAIEGLRETAERGEEAFSEDEWSEDEKVF